jgi:hypothetical protein
MRFGLLLARYGEASPMAALGTWAVGPWTGSCEGRKWGAVRLADAAAAVA